VRRAAIDGGRSGKDARAVASFVSNPKSTAGAPEAPRCQRGTFMSIRLLFSSRLPAAISVLALAGFAPATALASSHHSKHKHHHAMHHSSPSHSSGIPQHNGGDKDSDNNGGPSDGDGNF